MTKTSKEMVTIICAGCGKPFEKEKKKYENAKKWGRDRFYCKSRCAIDNAPKWQL